MSYNPFELISNTYDGATTLTDKPVQITLDYIASNSNDDTLRFNRDKLHEIYLMYMLTTTHSDLFIDTIAEYNKFESLFTEITRSKPSSTNRAIKKDLEKVINYLEKIEDIYHANYAGLVIDKYIEDNNFDKKQIFRGVGKLKQVCKDAVRYYSPEQGRRPSLERKARINMIAELIEIFDKLGLPHGSGQNNKFDEFLKDIYSQLDIYVDEPHEDIKLAKKKLLTNK